MPLGWIAELVGLSECLSLGLMQPIAYLVLPIHDVHGSEHPLPGGHPCQPVLKGRFSQ